MGVIRSRHRGAKHNQRKTAELLETIVGPDDHYDKLREQVRSLLAIVQADAVRPGDLEGIRKTLGNEGYDFCVAEAEADKVVELTNAVLVEGMDVKKYGFTFDDALYICAIEDVEFPHIDVVLVDEIQDWNNCQLTILAKWITAGARIVAIGDPDQSLYGFRGAQPDAFDRVRDILSGNIAEFLMPYCRRSGSMIVAHAAKLVPTIQALPDAPQGEIELSVPIGTMLGRLVPGEDMVLSRTNARLVRLMYTCIRMGIPAHMRKGKQEAGYLCWFVDMLAKGEGGPACSDVGELIFRAQRWLSDRAARTSAYKLEEHRGRVEVLSLICERVMSVNELKDEITRLFQPPGKGVKTVVLSTIHGAKGGEADRVWNISADLMPHPRAKSPAQQQQEKNAMYVCCTRARNAYFETVGELEGAREAA
jgi:DNA helicase-2/ATP-dependent DNA helicase PcrA